MDIASAKWMYELVMDDYNIVNQCNSSSLDAFTIQEIRTELAEKLKQSLSPESNTSHPTFDLEIEGTQTSFERPSKQLKTTNAWKTIPLEQTKVKASHCASSQILSFEHSNILPTSVPQELKYGDLNGSLNQKVEASIAGNINFDEPSNLKDPFVCKSYPPMGTKRNQTLMNKTTSHAQDHIMAERKRREKLSQRFVALSAVVPGLKKLDKATVLADAIKYIKQLQENVKALEEQTKKKTMESVVLVKKSHFATDDESSSCEENIDDSIDQALPEIEAKVSDKDVLLRIHCEMRKGLLAKILGEIEKLQLTVVNTSVFPFGNFILDITIIAQMDADFCITGKDLVKNLRQTLLKFM